ncbi:MAG: MaoC/PaaZ C-terminal domain-containing protein [Pseudomonadales bacterium]|nr:MaoC/PaaZ C-terminal domain-containing protein [Pseudomonadales bacterium]
MTTASPRLITNYCYEDISLDQTVVVTRTITADDIALFAALSGDFNPVHLDSEYAASTPFGKPIAHGMICGALISATVAMNFPGPGSIYRSQTIKFSKPVFIGDELTIHISVKEKQDRLKLVTLSCVIKNQKGKTVASGESGVIAPSEKASIEAATLPPISLGDKLYTH